jgi:hypothetical protein
MVCRSDLKHLEPGTNGGIREAGYVSDAGVDCAIILPWVRANLTQRLLQYAHEQAPAEDFVCDVAGRARCRCERGAVSLGGNASASTVPAPCTSRPDSLVKWIEGHCWIYSNEEVSETISKHQWLRILFSSSLFTALLRCANCDRIWLRRRTGVVHTYMIVDGRTSCT